VCDETVDRGKLGSGMAISCVGAVFGSTTGDCEGGAGNYGIISEAVHTTKVLCRPLRAGEEPTRAVDVTGRLRLCSICRSRSSSSTFLLLKQIDAIGNKMI
jgi:hypothetical protein